MMAYWFSVPPWAPCSMAAFLRMDPGYRFAHWDAGENAYCIHCGQQTSMLYAIPLPGPMPSDAVCRVCAVRAIREERQQH